MEKEVSDSTRRALVKKKYLEKISYFLTRPAIDPEELYVLIRGFFVEFLKLEYEFTYEELALELNKIFIKPDEKKEIDDFLYDLSECEYLADKDINLDEIKNYLVRMQKVIKILVDEEFALESKISLFDRLFKKKDNPLSAKPSINAVDDESYKRIAANAQGSANSAMPALSNLQKPAMTAQTQMINKSSLTKGNEQENKEIPIQGKVPAGLMNDESNSLFISPAPINQAIENKNIEKSTSINSSVNSSVNSSDLNLKQMKSMPANINSANKNTNSEAGMFQIPTMPPPKVSPKELVVSKPSESSTKTPQSFLKPAESLLIEPFSPTIINLHAQMEEAYMNISKKQVHEAKINYLKGLDLYHRLGSYDKKIVYLELFELFTRLKSI